MRKAILAFFPLLLFFFQSYSQKNYLPGYILRADHDTVKGLIDYRNWEKNPTRISFKGASSASEAVYSVDDIAGFEIYDRDVYKRADVMVDRNPIAVSDVYYYTNGLIQRDTVFLRQLAKSSNITLYELQDMKLHFYIQNDDGEINELVYTKTTDEKSGNLSINKGYIQQLKAALSQKSMLTIERAKKIDELEYTAQSLKKFMIRLSESSNDRKSMVDQGELRTRPKFFVGAGGIYQKFGLATPIQAYKSLQFSSSLSYIITAGIDIASNRNFKKAVFRGELSVSQFHVSNTNPGQNVNGYTYDYSMKQINITPAVSLLYNFIGREKTKVYGGVSAGYNISSYPENRVIKTYVMNGQTTTDENFLTAQKGWLDFYFRAGAIISDVIEVGGAYQLAGSPFNLGKNLKESGSRMVLRISYRFR